VEIGKKLPKSNLIALGFSPAQPGAVGGASDALSEFGMSFQFLKIVGIKQISKRRKLSFGHWMILTKDGKLQAQVLQNGFDIQPTMFRHIPSMNCRKKWEGGFERLGVLRMDVDSLGDLFKNGFGKNATLTRLASLSFRMSLFFRRLVEETL